MEKSPYTVMKADFDGFCSKCKEPLPKGTERRYHRFAKKIHCLRCVGSSKKVEQPIKHDTHIDELNEKMDHLLACIQKIAGFMEVDLDEDSETQTNFEPPKKTKWDLEQMQNAVKDMNITIEICNETTLSTDAQSYTECYEAANALKQSGYSRLVSVFVPKGVDIR